MHKTGYAPGGRIDGAPSDTDNILSWLASGEHVISARSVGWVDRTLGPEFLDNLNRRRIEVPALHFAEGGRTGGSAAVDLSSMSQKPQINVAFFDDRQELRKWLESHEGTNVIYDAVNRSRTDLGLGS
jgi:hypothetical protein